MIQQLRVQDVKVKLDAGEPVFFLDVRQPEEHAFCRLPGSQLIPLGELQQRHSEIQPPPGSTIVVYCHHGIRSLTAAQILQNAGFENVVSLAGGIEAWSVAIDPTIPRY